MIYNATIVISLFILVNQIKGILKFAPRGQFMVARLKFLAKISEVYMVYIGCQFNICHLYVMPFGV